MAEKCEEKFAKISKKYRKIRKKLGRILRARDKGY